MSFQIRSVPGENTVLGREIARMAEDAAHDLLTGVSPELYREAFARYRVLRELMDFMDQRAQAQEKGEHLDDD